MSRILNKKLLLVVLLVMCIGIITGCKLAREDKKEDAREDKLVGFYVTNKIVEEEKIYAKRVEKDEDGIKHSEYIFEELEGIAFYNISIKAEDKEGNFDYSIGIYDEEVSNVRTNYTTKDEGAEDISYTGTIYFTEKNMYYMNPVYQKENGDVYMCPQQIGEYVECYNQHNSEMSETLTWSKNGLDISETLTAKLEFVYKPSPENVEIIYMNKDNNIIEATKFTEIQEKEGIMPPDGTEYIIVESDAYDITLEKDVTFREIYDIDNKNITIYEGNGRGYCVGKTYEIKWK